MANPNPDRSGLRPPWKKGESGNPKGHPVGQVNLSTHIQNMLNDPEFEVYLTHPTKGVETFKGAPVKAIIKTAIIKAANNDAAAREWLAKHGYGNTVNLNVQDPLDDILSKFGIGEEDAGKDESPPGGTPEERT